MNAYPMNASSINTSRSRGSGFDPVWLLRYAPAQQPGEVVTFYSYKGGTGRSMALANCVGLMAAHWPSTAKPMLLIDFDLEAPGLHQYLREHLTAPSELNDRPGTLELFESLHAEVKARLTPARTESLHPPCLDDTACHKLVQQFDFAPYLVTTTLGAVQLIKAGRFDASYAQRMADMNWQQLFAQAPGIFRALAARWSHDFACTLIDARTGLSDTSGICTMLLPDVLTVVFTPNRQSLAGIEHLVTEAHQYRQRSADLRPLRIYPLPSRVEQTSEDYRRVWRAGHTLHATFGEVEGYEPLFRRVFASMAEPLPETSSDATTAAPADELCNGLEGYFDAVQVPHSPDYAFGERLCFGPEAAKDRLSLRTAFEAFLPWLCIGAQPWQSPEAHLEGLLVTQWLEHWAPPAEASSDKGLAFSDWLNRVMDQAFANDQAGAQVALGILLLLELTPDQPGQGVLQAALPQFALLRTLAMMQAHDWDAAKRAFSDSTPAVQAQGLASEWADVPRRWLQHHQASAQWTPLQKWLSSGCCDAMMAWVDAAGLARPVRWAWLRGLVDLLSQVAPASPQRKEAAQALVNEQQRLLGEEHPDTLTSMSILASTLLSHGRHADARALQERVLVLSRIVLGEEHPTTLGSMNNLASTLSAQGDFKEALAIQTQVLAVRRRVLGETHPNTLNSMSNLGSTLSAQGDFIGARALQEQVLVVRGRTLGEDHPDTLASMNNLAHTLGAQGDYTGARALQEQFVAVSRRVLGEDHPDTLTGMNNLALTLWAQGDYVGSRALQEPVLALRRRVLGEEHPDTLSSMNNLANTLSKQGDHTGARALHAQVLEVSRRVLSEEHPDTLNSMNNLASTLSFQGDHAGARALLEQTLAVSRRAVGDEHPATLISMNNLAQTLEAQGDHVGARVLQEQVLAVSRRVLGEEHPDTLTSMNNLASTLEAQGDRAGARILQEQVLALSRRVLGEEHPDTLTSMNNLAHTMDAQGEHTEAQTLFEQALTLSQKVWGEENPRTVGTFSNLLSSVQEMQDSIRVADLLTRYPKLAKAVFSQRVGSGRSREGAGGTSGGPASERF
jgi:tetratricopeptide (TPR) repeat protein